MSRQPDPIELLQSDPGLEIDLRGLESLAKQGKGRGESGKGGPPGTSKQNLRALLVMGHVRKFRQLSLLAAARRAKEVLKLRTTPRRLCDLYSDHEPLIQRQLDQCSLLLRLKRQPRTATRYFWDNDDDRYAGPSGGVHVGGTAETAFVSAKRSRSRR
jgi:hypothetical protein